MQLETNEIKSQLRQIQKELKTLKDKIEKTKKYTRTKKVDISKFADVFCWR